ncbi:MAG: branched-chain-amino-acid transaminase [Pseudomonadales bacterium]|jgi:branched-chain amino acid aminotransferase|nr:branched-chain-amino-acid transaminase [Gammaproteobacteria bacterium]|tara:strand:- start:3105 stop:3971 length:867 start_codon:yes stop_codon:yes gene_type:complete
MQSYSINGVICDASEAKVPVNDHGFLYGDGVFEGLRFYNGRILKLRAHLKRLVDSAKALRIQLPMSAGKLEEALLEVVAASTHTDGYLRLIVTRGVGPLGIDPSHCEAGSVVIIADQLKMVSEEARDKGARLIISSVRQLAGDQLDSRIKSLNYLTQIMAKMEANVARADEAVVLNQSGYVAEGSADNIFIVTGDTLETPPVTDGALDGITRGLILEIAKNLSIPVRERSLTTYDLYIADECFLTGTGAELIPVREISDRQLSNTPGPIYSRIREQFHRELQNDAWFD